MKLKMILFNIVITTALFSCDGRNTRDNGTSAEDDEFSGNTENRGDWDNDDRQEFIQEATRNNLKEIRAGEIAQNKAQSAEVRQFAQTLITDHRNANQRLQNIAQQLGQQNPESQQNRTDELNRQNPEGVQSQQQTMTTDLNNDEDIKKLQEAKNNEFDKEFIDMMVKDHEKAIDNFEDAQENVADQQLKSFIDNTLPVLRKHLETAKKLQDQQSS